MSMRKGERRRA